MPKNSLPKQKPAEPQNALLRNLYQEYLQMREANLKAIHALVQRAQEWKKDLRNKQKKSRSLK